MFEKLTKSARNAVATARNEASKRGDRRIGTDHLLLALLHDQELATTIGVDASTAADAASQLDRDALTAIGLEPGTFEPSSPAASSARIPMTAGAKATLQHTLATAAAEKSRTITARHMMLALLERDEPDSAATLFAALSIDRKAAREQLAVGR